MKSGFSGGLIIDYPNSAKAKKYYLVLEAGVRRNLGIVEVEGKVGEEDEEEEKEVKVSKDRHRFKKSKKKIVKRRDFVLKKKERLRRRGFTARPDTKYTARKRKPTF